MDPLVRTGDQGTIETVDFTQQTCVLSSGKVMATVFWDSQGVIYIVYPKKVKTVTELYYAELLRRFDAKLKKKRPHLAKKKIIFHLPS